MERGFFFLRPKCGVSATSNYQMSDTKLPSVKPVGPLVINPDSYVSDEVIENASKLAKGSYPPGYSPATARIMYVDDEEVNLDLVTLYLQDAGYKNVDTVMSIREAQKLLPARRPGVLLLDLVMPGGNGLELLSWMRRDKHLKRIPVIVVSGVESTEVKLKALELGVNEFLAKPVDPIELILRLRNTLAAKALHDHLANYSARLKQQVRVRTAELEEARQEAMNCLARAAEYRDDDTGQHVLRVGRYVAIIAERLGFNAKQVASLELAAQLHDVGKIGISDTILLKPGKLETHEFELMRQHCTFGKRIIEPLSDDEWKEVRSHAQQAKNILSPASSPTMKLAAVIAETHHEKWDGSGYPRGLAGEKIPIEGRITAVADVYDALSHKRPYKPAFPREKCFAILEEGRGRHFDPGVLDAFFASIRQILEVQAQFAEAHEEEGSNQ